MQVAVNEQLHFVLQQQLLHGIAGATGQLIVLRGNVCDHDRAQFASTGEHLFQPSEIGRHSAFPIHIIEEDEAGLLMEGTSVEYLTEAVLVPVRQ